MDDDAVSKVVAALFLTLGIFVLPLIIISVNSDLTERSYVDENIQEFSEMARSTGYISKENYEQLMNVLSSAGGTYKITMLHRSYRAIPSGPAGEYRTSYTAYGQNDIICKLYGLNVDGSPNASDPGSDYVMKDGDFFSITVEGMGSTKSASYLKALSGGKGEEHLYCTSGGMVGNTKR